MDCEKYKDLVEKALQILAENEYGYVERCYCSDESCWRNSPLEESVRWAEGVIEAFSVHPETKIGESRKRYTFEKHRKAVRLARNEQPLFAHKPI